MAISVQEDDRKMSQVLRKLFYGSSTTKDICESTFAWLHSKAASTTKVQKMSDFTKYLYTILSPYTEASGLHQLLPDQDDWMIVRSNPGKNLRMKAKGFFNLDTTQMPDNGAVKSENDLEKRRKVGALNDERSSAAMAYLVYERKSRWQNISLHWAGRVFNQFLSTHN